MRPRRARATRVAQAQKTTSSAPPKACLSACLPARHGRTRDRHPPDRRVREPFCRRVHTGRRRDSAPLDLKALAAINGRDASTRWRQGEQKELLVVGHLAVVTMAGEFEALGETVSRRAAERRLRLGRIDVEQVLLKTPIEFRQSPHDVASGIDLGRHPPRVAQVLRVARERMDELRVHRAKEPLAPRAVPWLARWTMPFLDTVRSAQLVERGGFELLGAIGEEHPREASIKRLLVRHRNRCSVSEFEG